MLDSFRAEWQKTGGNRWSTGLTVWIFPAGAVGVFALLTLAVLLGLGPGQLHLDEIRWTDQMRMAWQIAPASVFGQMLLAAFSATIFAGEAVWNTWKNIVPRQGRSRLILAKFAVASAFLLIAFAITSLVAGLGSLILSGILGLPVVPAIDAASLGRFAVDYSVNAAISAVSLLLMVAYAMVASLLTRSILFGVIGGVAAATLDFGSSTLLSVAAQLSGSPNVLRLVQIMPSYNVSNLRALAAQGTSLAIPAADGVLIQNSGLASVLLLAGWLGGLLALAILMFKRRDVA
ncbi:MAG: ABC transporter permease [Anaerolineae bacterium]|nr:ABC transporter permease [Anaerolineae bacterium]